MTLMRPVVNIVVLGMRMGDLMVNHEASLLHLRLNVLSRVRVLGIGHWT